jgi:ABC-type nitrate/sulfonate/bicarbonate transport system ATPase subunit
MQFGGEPEMAATAKLRVDAVAVSYATPNAILEALAPINLSVQAGRFVSLIGPSGCGKTTLFNVIAGLMAPTSGRVFIDTADATGTIGRVSYMLQKDLLLPWRTVLDNVVLGLEIRGVPIGAARERVLPYLRRYGLAGFEYMYPNALSGGMRQRAALMRTLILDCDLVLLDEPFGALDAQTKLSMQEWLQTLWADVGKTIVFITHDVEEAIYLSDEIYVMGIRPGRIIEHIQVDLTHPRPRKILTTPEFVAIKERCLALISAGSLSTTLAA